MSTPTFRDAAPFPEAAEHALGDRQLRANLGRATRTIRRRRDDALSGLEDLEELRSAAAGIKDHALSRLDELLETLEAKVQSAGGVVHYARDAAEARSLVTSLVLATGESSVVKVKSMTTVEIELNAALEAAGIDVKETDLAELIVQLGDDLPSHIVVPAIHRNRSEIRSIFLSKMGLSGPSAPEDLSDDPQSLAAAARSHLRERFLSAKVAISGANFAVAESGSLVVVESEGNGRMCLTLADTLISVVGIDKVVPGFEDLEVFLQLLAASATGEVMNPYTSIFTGVHAGDGPSRFHLVLLDNGRAKALSDRLGRQALRCIRCAACLNVCPVYERVGGHAYGSVYPGPIGAVLTPQLDRVATDEVSAALPFASTLCGACYEVCPVKIDIPRLLVHLRGGVVDARRAKGPSAESAVMTGAAWVFEDARRLAGAERLASLGAGLRLRHLPGTLGAWTRTRDAPAPARVSFRRWWSDEHSAGWSPPPRPTPSKSATPAPATTSRALAWTLATTGRSFSALGARMRDLLPLASTGAKAASSRARPQDGRAGRLAKIVPVAIESGARRGTRSAEATSAREVVLARVREALGSAPYDEATIPRGYRRAGSRNERPAERLRRFASQVSRYRAAVRTVKPEELPAAIAEALASREAQAVVIPGDLPVGLLSALGLQVTGGPSRLAAGATRRLPGGLRVMLDDGSLDLRHLDEPGLSVLTGSSLAIADTGTIVLDAGPGQGRRLLSLVPDHHVVVVSASAIVSSVPDAFARLARDAPQTWISGPSATSDIELQRVEGVHGPRLLDVLIVDDLADNLFVDDLADDSADEVTGELAGSIAASSAGAPGGQPPDPLP